MAKNVTGGLILLLGGSALIALAATDKGRYILDVLTDHTGPGVTSSGTASGAATGSPASGSGANTASGFGGFGTDANGVPRGGGGSGGGIYKTAADYSKLIGFVGEKAATVI